MNFCVWRSISFPYGPGLWAVAGVAVSTPPPSKHTMSSIWNPLSLHPPSHSDELKVSFPQEHVMLMTLNRPRHLNAMTPQLTADIASVLSWFDDESSLW